MTVIENLPITNTDNHESLLSCLSNRDISVVSLLTGSSGKVSGGRRKVEEKSTVDKIKKRLSDCGSPT